MRPLLIWRAIRLFSVIGVATLFLTFVPKTMALCQQGTCNFAHVTCGDPNWCCELSDQCVAENHQQAPFSSAPNSSTQPNTSGTSLPQGTDLCGYYSKDSGCAACLKKGGAWTALGCIETEPSAFLSKFLQIGIGLAGGIAFLLILFGGFQVLTSAGNPEQLNEGRELISSAIAGLLLVILSLFLMRLVGFSILHIPGFGG